MRAKTRDAAMQLLDRIRAIDAPKPEPANSPWKSSRQWAALWGVTFEQAQKELAKAMKAGVVKREMRVGTLPCGKPRRMPHFMEVKGK